MTRRDARGRAWEAYFTTTTRLTNRIETELKSKRRISLPEYNVLLQVSRAGDEGIRPSLLAHQVVFSPSRLTHTVNRLIARGFLSRTTCAEDGRGGLIHLTPEGADHFRETALVHRDIIRSLALNDLSDEEIEVLDRVFTRIERRIDDSCGTGAAKHQKD